jgi:hypothetical protein
VIPALRSLGDDVPPLTPDGDEARRWAEHELSSPVYAAAKPTVVDRIAQAIADFFAHLFGAAPGGAWAWGVAVVAAVVIVLLIVAGFSMWGRPRAALRSRPAAGDLFGDAEERSAAQLRRAADAAAARGVWDEAVVLRFRALARGLDERGVVSTAPGATAHGFARAAGRRIPSAAAVVESAAAAFDDVRYLRRPGTAELHRRVLEAEAATRAPALDPERVPA